MGFYWILRFFRIYPMIFEFRRIALGFFPSFLLVLPCVFWGLNYRRRITYFGFVWSFRHILVPLDSLFFEPSIGSDVFFLSHFSQWFPGLLSRYLLISSRSVSCNFYYLWFLGFTTNGFYDSSRRRAQSSKYSWILLGVIT